MSSDRRLQYAIFPLLKGLDGRSFVDVGYGYGRWGLLIRTYSLPSLLVEIDIWKPYLQKVKRKRIYDDLILTDAAHLPIKTKAVDVVVAFEIVEHLPASQGVSFLNHLETVAREKVFLSTPNFKYLQDEARGVTRLKNTFPFGKLQISPKGIRCEEWAFKLKRKYS